MGICVPSETCFESIADSEEDAKFYHKPHRAHRLIKCVLIGDEAVGKTALMMKYTNDIAIHKHNPTDAIDFAMRKRTLHGLQTTFRIWDTSAQAQFKPIIRAYLKSCAVVLCYDTTKIETFYSIKEKWSNEINLHSKYGCVQVLVGTKCDLTEQRQVSYELGRQLANEFGSFFFETSIHLDRKDQERLSQYIVCGYIRTHSNKYNFKAVQYRALIGWCLIFYHKYRYYANSTSVDTVFGALAKNATAHSFSKNVEV